MKIKTINVMNFQGLKGIHCFDLDKITALCQSNGAGKTSLLNAIRYGLTGQKPDGEMITAGEDSCAVKIVFDDGDDFMRMEYTEKGAQSKYFKNNQRLTQKVLNQEIGQKLSSVDNKLAKIISSQEVIEGLTSQEFGDVLLGYLPEQLDVDSILNKYYPEATEAEKEIIKKNLPEGTFESKDLDNFYKLIVELRRDLKKVVAEQEAVVKNFGDLEEPKVSAVELGLKKEKLMNLRDKGIIYNNALQNYNRAMQSKLKYSDTLDKINKEIDNMDVVPHTEDEVNMLKNAISQNIQTIESSKEAAARLIDYEDIVEKAIALIKNPDESKYTQEDVLKGLIQNLEDTRKDRENFIKANQQAIEDNKLLKEQLNKIEKEMEDFQKKERLQKQKEDIEKQIPQIPEKPEPVEGLEELNNKINEFNELTQNLRNYNELKEKEKDLDGNRELLLNYENLANSFSPKGKVKEAITSYYLENFAEMCNNKADKIKKGMKLKFVNEKGVNVFVDINGDDNYLPMSALSAGERATVIYLIIDMLNNLSGLGMIFLDELSILDNKTFKSLLDIIIEHQDDFDLCIISAVDHTDTIKAIKDKKISLLKVEKEEKVQKATVKKENIKNDKEDNSDQKNVNEQKEEKKDVSEEQGIQDKPTPQDTK